VALVGPNGSGKTTTLRCAVGLSHPDLGSIQIDGINLRARPVEARARLSYLAQRTEFPATLTVREILLVIAELRRAPARAVDREISLCRLSRLANRTVAQLSGGERQRVAIAALFIPDVAAYLLDEPTMNLDPIGTRLLAERLAALREEGRAVLFTTHFSSGLDGVATRVAVLRDGRIIDLPGDLSLETALEGLHEEEVRDESEAGEHSAFGAPRRQLWGGPWWARADSARSR
jgi:ABC-type multidrug transport system ATPase subunit